MSGRIFSGLPVAKLSRTRTWWPRVRKCWARLEPINPAPPVISIFISIVGLSF